MPGSSRASTPCLAPCSPPAPAPTAPTGSTACRATRSSLARIDPGPEYAEFLETIATTAAPQRNARSLGPDGTLDRTFASPHEARFTVRYSDTKQPARGVTVWATSDREMLRAGDVAATDDEGRATLRLRPGDYKFVIEPSIGDDHLPARGSFRVGQGAITEVDAPPLDPPAIVTMEARDAKTGAGIAGVAFQYETDSGGPLRELRSQFVIVEHPRTDEQGRLRGVLEPGRTRFFLGTVPPGWKYEGSRGEPVMLVAGHEMTIRWSFVRADEPGAEAGSGPALFPDDLVETWRRRDRLALPVKLRIRRFSYHHFGKTTISADGLEAFLDANDLGRRPDPAAALEARFPAMQGAVRSSYEILDDGRRLRNTFQFASQPGPANIAVFNGAEVVSYTPSNGHASIGERWEFGREMVGFSELCEPHWVLERDRGRPRATGKVRRAESGGRLTVEETTEHATTRWVVDRRTGFVHADAVRPTRPDSMGYVFRQYGPKTYRDGVVLPTVHVGAPLWGDKVRMIDLDLIDEVEVGCPVTPVDFAVAAPAGTAIVDHRPDRPQPAVGTTHYAVADVIAYADGRSVRQRPMQPAQMPPSRRRWSSPQTDSTSTGTAPPIRPASPARE